MRELSAAPFHASERASRMDMELYNEFQRNAANDFRDMKAAQSKVQTQKDVMDLSTRQLMKSVVWPPTKKAKFIPIPKDLPDGSLYDLNIGVMILFRKKLS